MLRFVVGTLLSVVFMKDLSAQSAKAVVAQSAVQETRNMISVSFKDTPIDEAVRTIAQKSGVIVTFVPNLLPAKRVSYRANDVTPVVAFTAILSGTNVRIDKSVDGSLVLVRVVKEKQGQGVIVGKIMDAKTGKGISGANVSAGNDRGVSTDDGGAYRLTGLAAGSHIITVRLVGYAKQSRLMTIGEGATITADFKLEPSANVLDQVIVTGTVVQSELRSVPNAITVITAKQIEERGITRIDQLFRGEVPGVFASNLGAIALLDEVTMFSRGATALSTQSAGTERNTNPIKTYVDGVELTDSKYLSQIDPRSIERIEILAGPQASTIYGSNAINGVMQIFTKRGTASTHPMINLDIITGVIQNNFSASLTPVHTGNIRMSGIEGRGSYSITGSMDYMGPWTSAKRLTRFNGAGGGRMDVGKLLVDITARHGNGQNRQNGATGQLRTSWVESGLLQGSGRDGRAALTTSILDSRTFGFTVGYRPAEWWSHEFIVGQDVDNIQTSWGRFRYFSPADTLLVWSLANGSKTSERYSTVLRFPVATLGTATLTAGSDHWRTNSSTISTLSSSLSGSLANPGITRDKPGKNTGGFAQLQIAMRDALYFTYGVRAEWNPNYGDDAQPNIVPRYGVAYTWDIGAVTTKVRASYGRSTRPPALNKKTAVVETDATTLAEYSRYNRTLKSADLGPEFQQGVEGGLEFYLGNRGSLVITRYNQTVDDLIGSVRVDSVRSLAINPSRWDVIDSDGYGYRFQLQYLNIGAIRNQGWELHGNLNAGPLATHGTYSWTKSRVIGITPRYRTQFSANSSYQVGRSFDYLPEHTWSMTSTYARASSTLGVTLSGTGNMTKGTDNLYYSATTSWRNPYYALRTNLSDSYRPIGAGYVMADVNAGQRLSSAVDGILQIQNLTNVYRNDIDAGAAAIGRQTKVGLRVRTH